MRIPSSVDGRFDGTRVGVGGGIVGGLRAAAGIGGGTVGALPVCRADAFDPVEAIASSGRTQADRILEIWQRHAGDRGALIRALAHPGLA